MEPLGELSTFSFPTRIRFGPGARRALAEFARDHQVARPLLVTDRGLPATAAYALTVEEVERLWPGRWQAFTDVEPNPAQRDVEAAYAAYRAADCDAVIGLGGGSALDAAKAVRLKAAFPEIALVDIPLDQLPRTLTPMCAIPTTAGTGSEVGRSTVITVPSVRRKMVFGGPPLMPDLALLDPELTVGLPLHLTAATGMDAMTHAIESYVCPMFHPMCDAIALEAIRLIREFLPRAIADGGDLVARGRMLIAASMGAVAFQKDLGAAHSLAHPLSTEFGVHHGLANAVVLPEVVRFNGEVDREQYRRVAEALGLFAGCAAEVERAADPAVLTAEFLAEFNHSLGIRQRLRDLGVPRDALPALATKAHEDGCHLTNPRPCSEADLLGLYERCW